MRWCWVSGSRLPRSRSDRARSESRGRPSDRRRSSGDLGGPRARARDRRLSRRAGASHRRRARSTPNRSPPCVASPSGLARRPRRSRAARPVRAACAAGRTASGELDLGNVPRGAFWISDAQVVLGDYLGLESVSIPVDSSAAGVVVHRGRRPPIALQRLGAARRRRTPTHSAPAGRLRLPLGAGVRTGRVLRRVHWPTTARRGQLMVKELEDDLRDAVVVLLDCDSRGAVGTPIRASMRPSAPRAPFSSSTPAGAQGHARHDGDGA